MNSIQNYQNEAEFLRLLKGQRTAYSNAKNFQIIDVISIIIAIIPTILILRELDFANLIAVIGVFWTIVSIFSEIYRTNQTKTGAVIQEQFDTELFEIPWNSILVGTRIDIAKIIELSRKYKKEDLQGWYSKEINEDIEHKIAVLLCYKENAIWGLLQRNKFIKFILIITILYYGVMILLSVYKNTGIYDLAVFLAPSLPFLVYSSTTIKSQKEIVQSYKIINRVVDDLLERFQKDKIEPDDTQLRQIQDLFYTQRIVPHKVPNWFYNIFRQQTNGLADEALSTIKNKLK